MCCCDDDEWEYDCPDTTPVDLGAMSPIDKLTWDVYRPAIEAMLKHSIADEFIQE